MPMERGPVEQGTLRQGPEMALRQAAVVAALVRQRPVLRQERLWPTRVHGKKLRK